MSLTTCRGCGQPLSVDVSVCGVCGVRTVVEQPSVIEQAPPVPSAAGPQSPQQFVQSTIDRIEASPVVAPASPKVIRLKGRHVALLSSVMALFLVGAIVAGVMTAPSPKPAGDLVGQLPFGVEGGELPFDGGAGEMKVPKGALSKPETIEVRRTIIRERVTAQSVTGAPLVFPPGSLIAYTFGPITIVLNRPITITLRLPEAGQGGLVFVTANGQITYFPGTLGRRTITFRLTSLDVTRPGAIVRV